MVGISLLAYGDEHISEAIYLIDKLEKYKLLNKEKTIF
jgi:hypothetical protein